MGGRGWWIGGLLTLAACGGGKGTTAARTDAGVQPLGNVDGGADGGALASAAADAGPAPGSCSDLFAEDRLQTYSFDISAAEWAKLTAEFQAMTPDPTGNSTFVHPDHPIVFHFGGETVSDAVVRLKGKSSWVETIKFDPNPKMQFVVSFDAVNTKAQFHGLTKLRFSMPRDDASYMIERLANLQLTDLGVPAFCANNARLVINGQYYGLYVAEEEWGHHILKRLFPEAPDGDLWKSGTVRDTNKTSTNNTRQQALWAAADYAALAKLVDIDETVAEWAGEAVINNGDGYYGGSHNFYVYDHPARGFLWLPTGLDSCYDFELVQQHPIFWWNASSTGRIEGPGQHYLLVMNDQAGRAKYLAALESAVSRTDVAAIQARIDAYAPQIADAAGQDPHRTASSTPFADAVAALRASIQQRHDYLTSFVDCEHHGGTDADGDGVPWCNDCNDKDPTVFPGAPESCDGIDHNCNGRANDACPAGDAAAQ